MYKLSTLITSSLLEGIDSDRTTIVPAYFKTIRRSKHRFRRCHLNDKERFALAERVQKRVQKKHPNFQLIKRRDEIEKKLKVENENRRS